MYVLSLPKGSHIVIKIEEKKKKKNSPGTIIRAARMIQKTTPQSVSTVSLPLPLIQTTTIAVSS